MRNHRKALFGRGVLIREMLRGYSKGRWHAATPPKEVGKLGKCCSRWDILQRVRKPYNKLESRKDAAPIALLDFGGTSFPAVEA